MRTARSLRERTVTSRTEQSVHAPTPRTWRCSTPPKLVWVAGAVVAVPCRFFVADRLLLQPARHRPSRSRSGRSGSTSSPARPGRSPWATRSSSASGPTPRRRLRRPGRPGDRFRHPTCLVWLPAAASSPASPARSWPRWPSGSRAVPGDRHPRPGLLGRAHLPGVERAHRRAGHGPPRGAQLFGYASTSTASTDFTRAEPLPADAGAAVIFALLARNLARSRIGRAFAAVRDRDIAAEMMGVNLPRPRSSRSPCRRSTPAAPAAALLGHGSSSPLVQPAAVRAVHRHGAHRWRGHGLRDDHGRVLHHPPTALTRELPAYVPLISSSSPADSPTSSSSSRSSTGC